MPRKIFRCTDPPPKIGHRRLPHYGACKGLQYYKPPKTSNTSLPDQNVMSGNMSGYELPSLAAYPIDNASESMEASHVSEEYDAFRSTTPQEVFSKPVMPFKGHAMVMIFDRLTELHNMLDEMGCNVDTPVNALMPHLRGQLMDILDERHAIACHLGDLGEKIEEVEQEVNELRIPHVLDGSMDSMEGTLNAQHHTGQEQGCHEMDALQGGMAYGGMNMDLDGYTSHNSGQNSPGYQDEAIPESNQSNGSPPQLEQQVWEQEEDPLDRMGGLEGLL